VPLIHLHNREFATLAEIPDAFAHHLLNDLHFAALQPKRRVQHDVMELS